MVPSVVGQRGRDAVGRIVQHVSLDGRRVFLSGFEVAQWTDGGGLDLRVGEERRVLLPYGQVVHGKAVTTGPLTLVVVGRRAFEAGAEPEAEVHRFTSPRREVEGTQVLVGEVVPAVEGAGGSEAVVHDVLGLCAPKVLLEAAVSVEASPHGHAVGACARKGCFLWATDDVPAAFSTADLNDGEIVPNVTDNETAGTVDVAQGTKAEMAEQFNAHERTVGAGKVHVFEDHGVVPVLSVTGPFVAAAVGLDVASPHEIGGVQVVGGDVLVVVAIRGTGGVVGL